jgi:hypothetical protein
MPGLFDSLLPASQEGYKRTQPPHETKTENQQSYWDPVRVGGLICKGWENQRRWFGESG